jgi:hypothetical protein
MKCRQGSKTDKSNSQFWKKLKFDRLLESPSQYLCDQRPSNAAIAKKKKSCVSQRDGFVYRKIDGTYKKVAQDSHDAWSLAGTAFCERDIIQMIKALVTST